MVERYFEKFSKINYNGSSALNLLSRVVVARKTKNNPYDYYDYQVEDGQRPDYIAYKYYDDPNGAWLIYLTNDVIDPYHDWKLDPDSFNRYIIDKYGSLVTAQKRIVFYRNNWFTDERQISANSYSGLGDFKKYWMSVDDGYGNPMYYARKPVDWTYQTNIISTITATYNSNSQLNFASGALVDVLDQYQNYKGGVEVSYANNTSGAVLTVKNVTSGLQAGYILRGLNGESANIVSSSIVSYVIPNTGESDYYSPVYAYDYELEKNSNLSTVKVISKALYTDSANQLKQELAK